MSLPCNAICRSQPVPSGAEDSGIVETAHELPHHSRDYRLGAQKLWGITLRGLDPGGLKALLLRSHSEFVDFGEVLRAVSSSLLEAVTEDRDACNRAAIEDMFRRIQLVPIVKQEVSGGEV